ncbi:hypothetical protein DdX_11797 [Ditylenchus destructor]|uniref:Uncharacterized protein n=1 Tax=Ditylenchus destructor TaxID=166010 RepID=A0AAD4R3Y8_9BILA|nr:hypothetical protein DdX_11797 [Ditylenchus destructor]
MLQSVFAQVFVIGVVAAAAINYPIVLDYRQIEWPEAEHSDDPMRAYTEIDCFTEMDQSFVSETEVYRIVTDKQKSFSACLIRIPTKTQVKFYPKRIMSNETSWRIIAGSSIVHATLSSPKIYAKDDNNGPWHVPCSHAYLIFSSKAPPHEVMEFTLESEAAADKADPREAMCDGDGRNYAQMESY